MNGQQLFYSFLPGAIAAVLAAQPSWANTAPVGQPELVAFPTSVLSSIDVDKANLLKQIRFDTVVAENIVKNTSLLFLLSRSDLWRLPQIAFVPFDSPGAGLSAVISPITVIASDSITSSRETQTAIASNTVITVTNLESRSANPEKDKNNLLTIADFYEVSLVGEEGPSLSTAKSKISTNISNIGSKEGIEGVENLDTTSAKKTTPSASLLQQLTTTKKKSTPLLTIAEIPANTIGASALMQAQVAQSPTPALNPPVTIPPTTPINRPKASSGPAPSYLNPNPNPLQFPTKPAEVRIQGTQPVTLDQVLELARRNNRDLQTALLQLERSRAQLREAQAALFPNLSINSTISRRQSASSQLGIEQRTRQQQVFESDALQGDEPSTGFSGQAQLSYNLYTSGSRQARIRQAEEQVRSSEFTVESQSEDVRLNVTRQYYDLQQADEQVRINQSAVVNAQASLRDAVALERAGVGTRFDVLRFQVNLANSQQNLTNSISQQRIAQRQLATTLSITQSVDLIAADPVRLAGLWNQSLEDSIVQALQNRPELQQRLAERNIGEQQRRQALSQLGPQLSLVASYDLLDQFNDNVAVTDGYSVGLQASLNLYEGGAARAQAAQARANIAIAENAFANQRNQVRFEVEQAFSQLQSNLENVQTANTALEQAREALRLARLRFQAGVGTQTDVISAENDLTLSEGNRIQAILNYNRALAAIQRAVTIRGTR